MGLTWLIFGAYYYKYVDWDIGVSLVMAAFTYLTAEKSVTAFMKLKHLPQAVFWTWFTVDGSYTVYHITVGNELLREAQWPTSLCLYLLCGLIWRLDHVEQTYDSGSYLDFIAAGSTGRSSGPTT